MSGSIGQVISFNEVPYVLEVPGEFIEVAPNYNSLNILPFPARDLIIAQMLGSGTGTTGVAYPVTRPQDATAFFGAGSQAETMAIAWLANNQNGTPLDVIGLTDAGGATKATGTFTVSGAAWPSGTPAIEVGDTRYYAGTIAGDTPTIVAAALAAAIMADAQCPCTATAALGVVTVTAKNAGVEGNNINLAVSPAYGDVLPLGMAIAVAAMAAGATNPSVAAAITAITGIWYTGISTPYQDTANTALLGAEAARRFTAMVRLDTILYGFWTGTLSQQIGKAQAVDQRFLVAPGLTNPRSPPWKLAAALHGMASAKLAADPARQLRGLALAGCLGSRPADRRIWSEEQMMLVDGVSTLHTGPQGQVTIQKLVTSYTLNAEGVLDPAYHEIHDVSVATRIRYDWRTYFALNYPRSKLAPDGSVAAQFDPTVVTPSRAKGSWAARMAVYEQNGWVINGQTNARAALFQIDAVNRNRLDATQPYDRIGNMMVLAGQLQFAA